MFVAAIVLLPVAVFGLAKWYEHRYTRLPVLGGKGHTIADFRLQDQHSSPTTLSDWKGKIVVADFFFTHCPVVCPKMTRSLKSVQQLYLNEPSLLITSFTVDPERDSVAQLKQYADRMDIGMNWTLLTGDKKELYRLARKSFLITATDGDGGPNDFIHSELLILVDPDKRIRGYYNGTIPAEVEELTRDIGRLKNEYKK